MIALFSPPIDQFLKVRKNLLTTIEAEIGANEKRDGTVRYWIHCASTGEFEQARPLIEEFKRRDESVEIVVTFFSPSGYQIFKDYQLANYVYYLPLDSRSNVRRFLDAVNPDVAIFIKYEFWFNFLDGVEKRGIPLYLASANFMAYQPFFKWWGSLFRKMLFKFDYLFVQDEGSVNLLATIGVDNAITVGDTRTDRVIKIAENPLDIPELAAFVGADREEKNHLSSLIAGSTWREDITALQNFYDRFKEERLQEGIVDERLKVVIAPHEINSEQISFIKRRFRNYKVVSYSDVHGKVEKDSEVRDRVYEADIFIFDTLGLLSSAYRYGDAAYVGGGFGEGIHNILEPIVFGIPVVFGPNHGRFLEAEGLINSGVGFPISCDKAYMDGRVDILSTLMSHKIERDKAKERAYWYISKSRGASEKIVEFIHSRE